MFFIIIKQALQKNRTKIKQNFRTKAIQNKIKL